MVRYRKDWVPLLLSTKSNTPIWLLIICLSDISSNDKYKCVGIAISFWRWGFENTPTNTTIPEILHFVVQKRSDRNCVVGGVGITCWTSTASAWQWEQDSENRRKSGRSTVGKREMEIINHETFASFRTYLKPLQQPALLGTAFDWSLTDNHASKLPTLTSSSTLHILQATHPLTPLFPGLCGELGLS